MIFPKAAHFQESGICSHGFLYHIVIRIYVEHLTTKN